MSDEQPFIPVAGQVDFTNIRWCPVVNCVVCYEDLFLLVERSASMRLYPNYWNGISGFIDSCKSLEEIVRTELQEELGLTSGYIESIELRGVTHQPAPDIGKDWIVHAVKVIVTSQEVTLDWEAQQYQWCTKQDLKEKQLLPGFDAVLDLVLNTPNRITSV